MPRTTAILMLLLTAGALPGATRDEVLARLERLEAQSQALAEEIRSLREELRASAEPAESPPIEERVARNERRVEEHAQAKVEAGQKLPVRLTGMVLFNAFTNSAPSGGAENPTVVPTAAGQRTAGAYMRQSLIGLEFTSPQSIAGARVSASLYTDFFAGSSSTLNHLMRIRTASVQLDWDRTTLLFGQQKPIFSPRDPTSFAQVGVSPLTNAGNPWLWQPQVRVEQRMGLGEAIELRAQVGVLQTNELANNQPGDYAEEPARARPALQGRFELSFGQRLQLAPGFHRSTTHVEGTSVPSDALSIDWLFAPLRQLQLTGLFYAGQNIANLGTLRQGFNIRRYGEVIPISSRGGWAQVALLPADRLSFHFMAGQHDDRDRDVFAGGIGKNQAYAGNVMYRIAPNVIFAFETSRVITTYLRGPVRRNWHNDLAVAYLF